MNSCLRAPRTRTLMAMGAALALVGASCSDEDDSAGPEVSTDVEDIVDAEEEMQDDELDNELIVDDPLSPLAGQEVTVSGDIGLVIDSTLFEIAGDDGSVLIIAEEGLPDEADTGTLVQVSGTVRQVLADTFDTDFGYAYDPTIYGGYLERLAVDADQVVILEGDDGVDETGLPAGNGEFDELNGSGVDGDVAIVIDDSTMSVTLSAESLSADLPHAMHVHFDPGQPSECPDLDEFDIDGDELLTTVEGVPAYGPVQFALTVDGETSPDSGLALDRFATADSDGVLTFARDIEVSDPDMLAGMQVAVVIHGMDIDESGEYDGDFASSLDPSVPLEATIPVACAVVELD